MITSELQRSRYNFYERTAAGVVGYNARTGTFALLSEKAASALGSDGPLSGLRDVDQLIAMGFVHRGDELARIIAHFEEQRHRRDVLHLTLVPTLACNLACDYCFQSHRRKEAMSEEIREATLRFVEASVQEGRKEVLCSWFGGEPLLCTNVICDMSPRISDIVAAAGGQLKQSIITNGTLLSTDTARRLAEAGISDGQVSFDALHPRAGTDRYIIETDGTPSAILRNATAANQFLRISARANVSRRNARELPEMVRVLEAHGFVGGSLNIARVHDFEGETAREHPSCVAGGCPAEDTACPETRATRGHGQSLARADYSTALRQALSDCTGGLRGMLRRLAPRAHFCSATMGVMYVVDPGGNVSGCWQSAGEASHSFGNVLGGDDRLDRSEQATRWRQHSPFDDPMCRDCRVLPLCMGGCAHPRVFLGVKSPGCVSVREQIEEYVAEVARHIEIGKEHVAQLRGQRIPSDGPPVGSP